ncbi:MULTISPECIES: efflux transporter outer membrane subunit [unclassified Variovorax]|uniref:efflux transporter outer membrane subunit n=1 Tax=unclassified Variovorax TaxID=663243 RepID=UPI00076BC846|nr:MULTISPECIES: efflux transporter outer membrane subunit [unclassified Variovorax]KWT79676.1 Outer membrane component of tripartite multidrug resistance system [Variovorax sp. WDL1]PNG52590.1 Toluene efflux pump outer membrane protein TtgF [Variovorax sp. B4]PNG55129.1 Toluene efflux pump outer membrane protein TtgF [Variovorax sp. B2]VTV08836.1 Toluene efflux pump outer membrane protein TtgF precursor [Variovorax sp. WDL1]
MHAPRCSNRLVPRLLAGALAAALAGCAVGPDFVKPTPAAPDDWTSWRSGDASLRIPTEATQALPAQWWLAFNDATLDALQQRAFDASPDLRTAALRFAQARAQRNTVAAQRGPEINASGSATRQRQSQSGAGTRMIGIMGADPSLTELLAEPFTLYQAGFDASWELDLWGRVRRSVEAADADVGHQAALLDLARLGLTSDVARNYFELRTAQRQIRLMREDIAALEDRAALLQARVEGGVLDHTDLQRQRAELAALKAQLPPLLAQEAASANQIALLLVERPGALRAELAPREADAGTSLPDLALGLPSEVALRRPDIRAAEARLHSATASIGIARADLYPSIRLGATFGYESYLSGEFSDWGSRTWSVGPSLGLPIFDHGRRKATVQLRELQQQEAAINYQQTVLKAWQEIDDSLSAYSAEQRQARELQTRSDAAGDAYQLAQARYDGGVTDFTAVLDAQRSYLQARRDLAASEGRLSTRYVTVNKAIGNVPLDTENAAGKGME